MWYYLYMQNTAVHEYFFYFLKFITLFQDVEHIRKHYTKKLEYADKMSSICSQYKLKEIDQRFWELPLDLDPIILTNEYDVSVIFQEYKDFILTYGEEGYVPKTVSSWK